MKSLNFIKMHGLGNDFVIYNSKEDGLDDPKFIKQIADRKTGIGCDLVVITRDSDKEYCDIYAKFINSDGTTAEICGNALRCLGKELFKLKEKKQLVIETDKRLIDLEDYGNGNVCVDMGKPNYDCSSIPLSTEDNNNIIDFNLEYLKNGFALNIGNPHLIFFVNQLKKSLLEKDSKEIESLNFFPEGVNISVVKVINDRVLKIMTHERGVGVTQACGSAACASVIAAKEKKHVSDKVGVEMTGGKLNIEITNNNHVLMIGEAKKVYEGVMDIKYGE
jgi:diaminopimelate epimerase